LIGDTSGGSFTITLPASPTTGANVSIVDGASWENYNLTIARNGSTIEGLSENLVFDIAGIMVELIYDGSTWEVYASVGHGVHGSGGGGEFNTKLTNRTKSILTGSGGTVLTLPSTAGKKYIIHSIHCANITTQAPIDYYDQNTNAGSTSYVIASYEFSGIGVTNYFAHNIEVAPGDSIELLRKPQVLNPSDQIKMRSLNSSLVGVNNAIEVEIVYEESDDTTYFGYGYGSDIIASIGTLYTLYTSSGYPSTIESIRVTNPSSTGNWPISIQINNGGSSNYLFENFIIPLDCSVELLDMPKRLDVNGSISASVWSIGTIDIQISGKTIYQ